MNSKSITARITGSPDLASPLMIASSRALHLRCGDPLRVRLAIGEASGSPEVRRHRVRGKSLVDEKLDALTRAEPEVVLALRTHLRLRASCLLKSIRCSSGTASKVRGELVRLPTERHPQPHLGGLLISHLPHGTAETNDTRSGAAPITAGLGDQCSSSGSPSPSATLSARSGAFVWSVQAWMRALRARARRRAPSSLDRLLPRAHAIGRMHDAIRDLEIGFILRSEPKRAARRHPPGRFRILEGVRDA